MPVFRECGNFEACIDVGGHRGDAVNSRDGSLNCEGCHTYEIYKKGFNDGVKALASELNRLSGKSKVMREVKDHGRNFK